MWLRWVLLGGWAIAIVGSIVETRRLGLRQLPYMASVSGFAIVIVAVFGIDRLLFMWLPSVVSWQIAVLATWPLGAGWLLLVGRLAGVRGPLWGPVTSQTLLGFYAVAYFFSGIPASEALHAELASRTAMVIGVVLGAAWAWRHPIGAQRP